MDKAGPLTVAESPDKQQFFTSFNDQNQFRMKNTHHCIINATEKLTPETICNLKLIGKNVLNLEILNIQDSPNVICDVYQGMKMLQSLKVTNLQWILDFGDDISNKLQTILVESELTFKEICQLQKWNHCGDQLRKVICNVMVLKGSEIMGNEFMEPHLKDLLVKLHATEALEIKTNYNLIGQTKMNLNQIIGLKFVNSIRSLQPLPLLVYLNELHLDLTAAGYQDLKTFKEFEFRLPSVRVLKLAGNCFFTCFDQLFNICNNVTYLEILDCRLRNDHIMIICMKFEELRHLILLGHETNVFSLEPFMDVNVMFSLKNLTKLVEIVIESNRNYTTDYQQQVTDRFKEWPALPKLQYLHLSGYCFSQISMDQLHFMAQNCPVIESFVLDTNFPMGITHNYLNPLFKVWGSKLLHICINSPNDTYLNKFSKQFVNVFVENCTRLKYIRLTEATYQPNIKDLYQIFSRISSLETIKIEYQNQERTMTRHNFYNMKSFLAKNLHWFSENMDDTLQFINQVLINSEHATPFNTTDSNNQVAVLRSSQRKMSKLAFEYLGISQREFRKTLSKIRTNCSSNLESGNFMDHE